MHKDIKGHNLYINGKIVQNVEYCKYVKIIIDSDLKWQEQII